MDTGRWACAGSRVVAETSADASVADLPREASSWWIGKTGSPSSIW
ncbi:hypothetical protein QF026_000288 [Streptomyces aurantiacus]|nr:hypothetical protein [Streptomyces aurantiacus]